MITSILALIQALPEFLSLMNQLSKAVLGFMEWAKTNDLKGWVNDLEASVDKLKKAKSSDDKVAAVQSLLGSVRRL